jgi:hypothetical protein
MTDVPNSGGTIIHISSAAVVVKNAPVEVDSIRFFDDNNDSFIVDGQFAPLARQTDTLPTVKLVDVTFPEDIRPAEPVYTVP